MVLAFKDGKIKTHSYLLGGRHVSLKVPLGKLDGCYENIDMNQSLTLGLDFASVQFSPGRKTTDWKRIEVMFKDCMTSSIQFTKLFIYARWRILEAPPAGDGSQGSVSLHLEVLPLKKDLDNQKAELYQKYKSSSNISISLVSIPLTWRKPDVKRKLFTTPCLVIVDSKSVITDGIVRFSMATVRDFLRGGRPSETIEEHKATVSSPVVLGLWGRSRREVFMPECDSFEVIGQGNYEFHLFY